MSTASTSRWSLPDADPLLAKAEAFRAHPAYLDVLRAYIAHASGFRGTSTILNKLVSYHVRWRVASYLFYLAADRDQFGPDGGASYSNLIKMCERSPSISPRTLKTMLALLQYAGMITARRSVSDGRSKLYQPTARMQQFIRPWLLYATRTLDLVDPSTDRTKNLLADPDFIDRTMVSAGRAHEHSIPLIERMPDYTAFFGGREGATAVLLALMSAELDGPTIASQGQIAKRYGISKSQVAKVIRSGETLGFFTIDEAGLPRPTPLLKESFSSWVSIELAFYATHMPASA